MSRICCFHIHQQLVYILTICFNYFQFNTNFLFIFLMFVDHDVNSTITNGQFFPDFLDGGKPFPTNKTLCTPFFG